MHESTQEFLERLGRRVAEARHLGRPRRFAERIRAAARELAGLGDDALRERSLTVRWRAYAGASADDLLLDGYALVSEAVRRVHDLSYYDVQLMAGVALVGGGIAEMRTGEGKTLTALLPAYVRALAGKGCHVVTANDYLAQRDAAFARPVFELLGLTVGCVHDRLPRDERGGQYACDVTYGTSREFGFDFLRDAISADAQPLPRSECVGAREEPHRVQREHYFALIDEADSVLLDDARTPLLIATQRRTIEADVRTYEWSNRIAGRLKAGLDFTIDEKTLQARLSTHGTREVLRGREPARPAGVDPHRLYGQIEHALVARYVLSRDRDYVVGDEGVSIVDQSTGRVSDGRKWQDGLHQAVEAKEGLPPSVVSGTAARVTVQCYFRRYAYLAGLTGTAREARREFRRVYGLRVLTIPTCRQSQRRKLPPRVFISQEAKCRAIVREVEARIAAGGAVLVGTPSVRASEALSRALREAGIGHEVLNCRAHDREAEIVARAGLSGRVTVATNMAGRGTDIRVDDHVRRSGGLHVIATEMHASRRTDRQLIGRTARQGEPGSYQYFLSLDDELLDRLDPAHRAAIRGRAMGDAESEISRRYVAIFRRIQRGLERQHERERRRLLQHDRAHERRCRELGLNRVLECLES